MKLTVLKKNLTFSEALQALKERKWIKCPEWEGYWFLKGGSLIVKTWDGQELKTPWLNETVLREDWQIVEHDVKEMMEAFMSQPTQFYKEPNVKGFDKIVNEDVDTRTETPVQDNSHAFHTWLSDQDIEWEPSGHQTLIIGNRDMFHIGQSWSNFKRDNQPNIK